MKLSALDALRIFLPSDGRHTISHSNKNFSGRKVEYRSISVEILNPREKCLNFHIKQEDKVICTRVTQHPKSQ